MFDTPDEGSDGAASRIAAAAATEAVAGESA
jgi:hypothetical protein